MLQININIIPKLYDIKRLFMALFITVAGYLFSDGGIPFVIYLRF